MMDIKGPEIRTGARKESTQLTVGQVVDVTGSDTAPADGEILVIPTNYPKMISAVPVGGVGSCDIDDLADGELGGLLAGAGTNFRAFDVHHHRELLFHAAADLADAFHGRADPGMVSVGHVEADHVGPGLDDRF